MTDNFEDQGHNNDDFIEPEIGVSEEKAKSGGQLAEAWRTRPLFKFTVLLIAVFAVGVAAFNFLGGNTAPVEVAHLGKPPSMKEAPGGAVSPYMKQQTELANKERSDQAIASGGSALPTPIGQTTDVGAFGGNDKKDDALNELRAETERLKQQVQVQQQQVQQQQVQVQQQQQRQEPFDNTLAEAMQRQMQQMLESWTPHGIKAVAVSKLDATEAKDASQQALATQNASASTPAGSSAVVPRAKIVVNAGTVSYAQLLTEANSDVPGPILAQIVSGPLAGARAVGSFMVSDGYEKYLVLKFTLADKKGKDYQINAIALDPNTTLGGMATEVDERYFVRVVLPAAAGFLQGLGQAMGQGNSSITTNGTTTISTQANSGFKQGMYTGLGDAANTMGQFFQNQANLTKPLVRVAAGTPMGMFFVSPVSEPTSGDTAVMAQPQAASYPQGAIGGVAGMNGAAVGAYPGTTVSGYGSASGASNVPYPNYATPGAGYYGNVNAANSRGIAGYGASGVQGAYQGY